MEDSFPPLSKTSYPQLDFISYNFTLYFTIVTVSHNCDFDSFSQMKLFFL